MTRIVVHPDRLRQLQPAFQHAAEELALLCRRLDGALSSLSWEMEGKSEIEGRWSEVRNVALQLRGHGEALARHLADVADQFERADEHSANSLAAAVRVFQSTLNGWQQRGAQAAAAELTADEAEQPLPGQQGR